MTECATCQNKYYPATATPTASCLSCPPACSLCTSFSVCTGCEAWAEQSGSDCLCPSASTTYLTNAGDQCVNCNLVIASCSTCAHGLTTTCTGCDPGFSVAGDSLSCIACPLNCIQCPSVSVCGNCTAGYTWNGGTQACECGAGCAACQTGITPNNSCSDCNISSLECYACSAPYYLDNVTCVNCMPQCTSCVDGSTCIGCNGLFILGTDKLCHCDNAGGLYLSIDTTTCQACGTVVTDCLSCT